MISVHTRTNAHARVNAQRTFANFLAVLLLSAVHVRRDQLVLNLGDDDVTGEAQLVLAVHCQCNTKHHAIEDIVNGHTRMQTNVGSSFLVLESHRAEPLVQMIP